MIMIIPRRTRPFPSFFKTAIALGYFFAQFYDHLGTQVHPETNFGNFREKKNANGRHNFFQQIRGEREIYRHKYVKVCMKYGVCSEYQV